MIGDFENPAPLLLELANLIKLWGYRCDSISVARTLMFKPGFKIVCNNYRYKYEIVDKGGIWTVCFS